MMSPDGKRENLKKMEKIISPYMTFAYEEDVKQALHKVTIERLTPDK
jgi:hypothetical protein